MSEANASERDAAVAWLYGRINYEATSPIPYHERGMKLDRMRELARRLGDPADRLPLVHVAGTKGKGSTAAMIAGALRKAGRRVGVYSSPHFDRIEERFAVDGAPCTADDLVGLIDEVRRHAEAMDADDAGGGGPTFFDLTTAMALVHFARQGVDAAVLEVGLGGRLDSTNIVTPLVSVITSISFDHMEQLGDTLGKIAAEKAGIIKRGVPVVSGVVDREPAGVIEQIAAERGAELRVRERDFRITPTGDAWRYESGAHTIADLRLALPGRRQAENGAVALATLELLSGRGLPTTVEERRQGVAAARLPGRMERFAGEPLVVIDGAHNDASAQALSETLDELCGGVPRERRVLVIGVAADKDALAVVRPLAAAAGHVVATRFVENPRGLAPESLATLVREAAPSGVRCSTADSPADAYAAAKTFAGHDGAVIVTGSLLLAAEARRLVVAQGGAPPI